MAQLLHPLKTILFATDINAFACSASVRTSAINQVRRFRSQCIDWPDGQVELESS
jgi:hypothetical protein